MKKLLVCVLVLLGACGPRAPGGVDAGKSCDVGSSRACGCGPGGLDGVGVEVCAADGPVGVWVCRCDAGGG